MTKLNLRALAANAARAKRKLQAQEATLKRLTTQLIQRVGVGGQTIETSLGQVVVTQETYDRNAPGFVTTFNVEAFQRLDPKLQMDLHNKGVVMTQKVVIHGQAPKVQFRLTGV